jgi:hypothetical protein
VQMHSPVTDFQDLPRGSASSRSRTVPDDQIEVVRTSVPAPEESSGAHPLKAVDRHELIGRGHPSEAGRRGESECNNDQAKQAIDPRAVCSDDCTAPQHEARATEGSVSISYSIRTRMRTTREWRLMRGA